MLLLLLFALVAGAVTAVTPCVLPVLPALLASTSTGGRRRPLGVVTGLALTHFVTILGLATLVGVVGLADAAPRWIGIAVLTVFGLVLAVPPLAHRVERRLAGLTRFGPRRLGEGFGSGLAVGGALGFVYAPCAGPILAGVIGVSATRGATLEIAAVAAAYSIGSALTLLLLGAGGRRLIRRVHRGPRLQQAMGALMVLTAVVMALELDVRFQTAIADDLPRAIVNPTRALERSDAAEEQLAELRGRERFAEAAGLPVLGSAPEFGSPQKWLGSAPLTIAGLRGRVVLIDFWTYTCINCIRTLPFVRSLDERYRDAGLTVVGVHTPEFAFERDTGNVRRAIADNQLRYPVVQDNEYATWNNWGNRYWPAKYLVDARGQVRYAHFGEGAEHETEQAIRALLREAGADRLRASEGVELERGEQGVGTPETYLGAARAERFLPAPPRPGTRRYAGTPDLPPSHFALRGTWRVDEESATAVRDARIDAVVEARQVFLVLASAGDRARRVRVLLDGRPIPDRLAGRDVRGGVATVRRQRLYRLVDLGRVDTRRITLELDGGVSGYAFTFG